MDQSDNVMALCEYFGIRSLRKHRENIIGCCPFHKEMNPSWGVSFVKMVYNCYSCGMKGSLFHMVWHLLPDPTVKAVQDILERFHLDVPNVLDEEWVSRTYTPIPEYYLTAYPALQAFRGHKPAFLSANKLRYSALEKRVIVPFYWEGKFQGMISHGEYPKTVPLHDFPFKQMLYRPFTANASGLLILCEGFADALRILSYNHKNVAAINGTSFTEKQEQQTRSLCGRQVVCMFDNDRGGNTALMNVRKRLNDLLIMDARDYHAPDPDKMTAFGFLRALRTRKIVP